jgi:hypothetical protein
MASYIRLLCGYGAVCGQDFGDRILGCQKLIDLNL